jgi:hypothetical protein
MTPRPAEEMSKKILVVAARFTFDNYAAGKYLTTLYPALAADTAKALSIMYPHTVYSVWSIENNDWANLGCSFLDGKQMNKGDYFQGKKVTR